MENFVLYAPGFAFFFLVSAVTTALFTRFFILPAPRTFATAVSILILSVWGFVSGLGLDPWFLLFITLVSVAAAWWVDSVLKFFLNRFAED